MALFGAPVTHEDHVRRALLAALAIRRALGEADDRDAAIGHELQVRIGIHAGPVVFGAIGGNFRMDTAIGDTANLAARLQQAAEPGEILVSEAVRALAQGYARARTCRAADPEGQDRADPSLPPARRVTVALGPRCGNAGADDEFCRP